jgi:DNA-binding transcriptional LysR family regulator
MNYTLNQLHIFLKIVETRSITKAAEELNLTQPAVSIQLKNFQNQFDIPVTEIIGRKIYITDFGKEIAEISKSVIDKLYELNFKTLAYKGHITGKLKISVVSTGKYVMPFFLSEFLKTHNKIDLMMDVTNKNQVIESILGNKVDFALVSLIPASLQIEKIDLLQNKLFLVGNKLPDPKETKNLKKFLENSPLIFREKGSGTRQIMEKFLDSNNIFLRKKLELTSNEAVKQALIAGLGYSIMPLIGIKNELQNKDLVIIPIEGLPLSSTWSLIWQKEKTHSPIAGAFLDFLTTNHLQIVESKFKWYEQYI